MLAHAPVDVDVAAAHGGTVFQHLAHQGVHREALGHGGDALGQALPFGQGDGGFGRVGPLLVEEGRPVDRVLALEVGQHRIDGVLAGVHGGAVGGHHLVGAALGQHALGDQLVTVQLARAGVLADLGVHQRLRQHRRVLLVVAELAEAHDVDHHVLVEVLPVLQRQLGGQHHGLGVVAVHVQHRRLDHLDHVGAVQGGARVARVAGGEADLVVDDDVHRAAGVVAARLRQRQRFHHHALAGEGGVAVHQHGQHGVAFAVAAAVQSGAHAALDHRVDDLEVRGVEGQRQVHRATGRADVGAEALVVFHVTGGQVFGRRVVELGEQHRRHLAQRVDQHVQAAAVGHADHDFLNALLAGLVDQLVHGDDEAFAAFQREALLADVLGVQEALQTLGGGQALQHVDLLLGAQLRVGARALQLLLPPALLALVGDVHELGADGAAVGFAQRVQQIAQRHGVLAEEGVAGVEHRLHVGIGEAVEGRLQLGDGRALGALERVQIGPAGADVAVGGDQLLDGGALAAKFGIGAGRLHHLRAAGLGALGKGVDDGQVRHVLGVAAIDGGHVLQGIEILAPRIGHAAGIGEVVFVHLLDIRRVAAEEIGVALVGLIDGFRLAHCCADLSPPLRRLKLVEKPSASRLNRLADATGWEGPGYFAKIDCATEA